MSLDFPTFAAALRHYMDLRGLRQADLARHLDTSTVQVSRWLKGQRPDDATLEQVLDRLGLRYRQAYMFSDSAPAAGESPAPYSHPPETHEIPIVGTLDTATARVRFDDAASVPVARLLDTFPHPPGTQAELYAVQALTPAAIRAGVRPLPPKCLRKTFASLGYRVWQLPRHQLEAYLGHRATGVETVTADHYLADYLVEELRPVATAIDTALRHVLDRPDHFTDAAQMVPAAHPVATPVYYNPGKNGPFSRGSSVVQTGLKTRSNRLLNPAASTLRLRSSVG